MIGKYRRTVQVLALALLVLIPVLNTKGITWVSGSLYSLAIGPVWLTDPLIGAQTILTTLTFDLTLFLSILIPVLFTFALGRVFCGWICPQNVLSEAADLAASKLGIRRRFKGGATAAPRYAVLGAVLMLTSFTGIPLASLLSAPGIISVQTAKVIADATAGLELVLVALILLCEFFLLRRAWCNYFCPVGSFLGLFRFRGTLKVVFAEGGERACGRCMACAEACQLGLNPVSNALYPQCHNCGACISACEGIKGEKKPLVFRFW